MKSWNSDNPEKDLSTKLVSQDYFICDEFDLFQIN